MTMFKSDVQSVCLSGGYSWANAVTTAEPTLIKVAPFTNQSFFQMVDVTNLPTVLSLV